MSAREAQRGGPPVLSQAVEPHLSFTPDAWRQLVLYTTLCPFEIGGLGRLETIGEDFRLTDIHLVDQDVNDIVTRLDGASVSRLIGDMVDGGEDPATLRVWWHSHAREENFWSGEDEQTIAAFQNELMVSLVTNHELRMLARLDRYAPRTTTWVWVDRPPEEIDPTPAEVAATRATIAQAVRYVPQARRERVI